MKITQDQILRKRSRRGVQLKLSFFASHQACGARIAEATALDALADNGRSNLEEVEKEGKQKRNKTIKLQEEDPKELADNDIEAQELSCPRRKSIRNSKNKQFEGKTFEKYKIPAKFGHGDLNSKKKLLNQKFENVKDCNAESSHICGLMAEAKKAAEENLQLSAGRKAHPFFSICRAKMRSLETKEAEKSVALSCLNLEEDYCISLPPVHVFDMVEDNVTVLNWEDWKFLERTMPKLDGCGREIASVFEISTKCLIMEDICGKNTKFDNLLVDEKMMSYRANDLSKFSSELLSKDPLFSQEMLCTCSNVVFSSADGSISDVQDQDKMHKERLASYFQRSICFTDCSLWTEKYRPEISLEVCGNADSVKLLNDWLKSWQERGTQNITNGNRNNCSSAEDSTSTYDAESDVDEVDFGDSLKNVLLITGPVGSGKSAAIYVCAREQGYRVIEVNASSLRNGAYMRQTFGEGVDSFGLTHWLAEDQANQHSKDGRELQWDVPVIVENNLESDSIKVDSKLLSIEHATGKSSHYQIANKTLFLFEEVDVVFEEDHGFVSTIFKLAETTKRPIILTSNSKQPVLPHLLDRLVLDFKAPSYNELLYYASMVCAFEKVHVSYCLLEHIIKACAGDIRRVLMLLQFWCQGVQDKTEQTIQVTKCPVPFDVGAAHLAIPKVIPWEFRCKLSEFLEEEISKTVYSMEENSIAKDAFFHMVNSCENDDPVATIKTTTGSTSRKKRKLRKCSIVDQADIQDHMSPLEDNLYDSDSPSKCFFQSNPRTKRGVVFSSQSGDELSFDELKHEDTFANQMQSTDEPILEDTSTAKSINGYNFHIVSTSPLRQSQDETCETSHLNRMDESKIASVVQIPSDISNSASTSHVYNASIVQVAVEGSAKLCKLWEGNAELLKRDHQIGCLQNEEPRPSHTHSVDHCSPLNLSTTCIHDAPTVSESWRRFRRFRNEYSMLLSPHSKDVSLVASLTSGLTDMMSEADIILSKCNSFICDNFEPTLTHCLEPDSMSWYEEQAEMAVTFAQHGLSLYTADLAAVGPRLGCDDASDLAQEVLACSRGSTALGMMLARESIAGQNFCFKNSDVKLPPYMMPFGRASSVAELHSAILPIVPARLSMALKGVAFHEYLSFVGQISRYECSRIAECLAKKQRRRWRSRMHYLSSGAHQLTSEQTELLAQRSCFTRSSRSLDYTSHGSD